MSLVSFHFFFKHQKCVSNSFILHYKKHQVQKSGSPFQRPACLWRRGVPPSPGPPSGPRDPDADTWDKAFRTDSTENATWKLQDDTGGERTQRRVHGNAGQKEEFGVRTEAAERTKSYLTSLRLMISDLILRDSDFQSENISPRSKSFFVLQDLGTRSIYFT